MILPLIEARIWVLSAAAGLVFAATGCTSSYKLTVDSISHPQPPQVLSYKIRSVNPDADEGSLRHQEAAEYIKTALSAKGMYEAPDIDSADMVVEIDYGVEPPRVVMERSTRPVYAQVGGGVRYDTVAIGTDKAGNAVYRTVPVYQPTRTEVIGYQDMMTPVALYEKYLRISARENREMEEGRPPAEIWSVHVTSEDESDDLRKYLPILASASMDYIGTDTGTKQTIRLRETDSAVGFVKQGM